MDVEISWIQQFEPNVRRVNSYIVYKDDKFIELSKILFYCEYN